jgi:GH25 family lysozyme M1 (1,4-beta-N-acetylmuramidase)
MKRSIRGIDVTENQYRVMHEAQDIHDTFVESVYIAAEAASKKSQSNLDEVWRKICEEGYAK